MKKTFNFGFITFDGRRSMVTVEAELKTEKPQPTFTIDPSTKERIYTGNYTQEKTVFTASGSIGNSCGGQCLDEIAKYIDNPTFKEIYRLWTLYHLNDMHPACEHQRALGWEGKATTSVNLYHFRLNQQTHKLQKDTEKMALDALKKGKTFTPTPEQAEIAALPWSLTSHIQELSASEALYYEPKKPLYNGDKGPVESKELGWLRADEHPDGLLSRPCPVCGYKYGHSWCYVEIPADDLEKIKTLLA